MGRIEQLEARRLFATLTPDAAWADDGYLGRRTDSTFVASTRAGVLVAEGPEIGDGYLARYTVDGARDHGFHDITLPIDSRVAVDTRGRIYVATNGKDGLPTLRRYNADGRPDSKWANGVGISLNAFANFYDSTSDLPRVMLSADGSVFVHVTYDDSVYDLGDYLYGGRHDVVLKFSDSGVADTAFADNGQIDFSSENAVAVDFVWTGVQADGHVVLVQSSGTGGAFVTRYRPNGKIDKIYRQKAAASPVTGELIADSIALDPHDRLTIAERLAMPRPGTKKADYAYVVRRYSADGRPDKAFGTAGVVSIAPAPGDDVAGIVLPQRDGKLIVQLGSQVYRLKLSGLRDKSFAPGGVADLYDATPGVVGQLPDGSLLAFATIDTPRTSYQTLARLAPDVAAQQGRSGTLYVYGTDATDTLNLYSAGKGVGTAVDLNGERLGTFRDVTAVVADLSEGDDAYIDELDDVPQTVLGGDGDDTITTANGDDSVRGGDGHDRIFTGGGDDRVYAEDGDDFVSSGDGYDRIDLGTGDGTVDAGSGGGEIGLVPLKTERVSVRGAGGDWLVSCYGGHADVVLTGRTADIDFAGALSSTFDVRTTDGATIQGGRGNDSIVTGDGNDFIRPDAGNDTVASGAGNDTIVSDDELYGEPLFPTDDRYDLGPGNDLAVDSFGDNTIVGGDGDDSIRTGSGDDSLVGNAGGDTIRGGQGNDTLLGNGGRDRLFGYEGDDLLSGGANDDTLYGGGGDDTLDGGAGNNVLR